MRGYTFSDIYFFQKAIMTTPTSATPSELTATFGLSEKTSYHLSARDFERGTQAVYGKAISVLESPNDTTHEYCDVGTEPPFCFDEDDLAEAIKYGGLEAHRLGIVLHDLHMRGVLPAGDYYIRVSW